MAAKSGSRSAQNMAVAQRGVVIDVDSNLIALVRMGDRQVRVRADTLRGKSAPPKPGEVWIMDQPYGVGWQFAVPLNWTADRDWRHVTGLQNSWTDVGAPNLPTGYRKEVEGFVTLCGQLRGGTEGSVAFVLPSGYRPEANWGQGDAIIDSAGNVRPKTTTPCLDGVRFYAA